MKTILLNRHAKSDWNNIDLTDFERPLNNRGERDAPEMAERLLEKNIKIDKIITSPAIRAISTARVFAEKLEINEIQEEKDIYHSGEITIKKLVNELPDNINTVLFFGHNPDFTSLARYFSGELFANVPTCGIVCIDFDINTWKKIHQKNGKVRFFDFPKNDQ